MSVVIENLICVVVGGVVSTIFPLTVHCLKNRSRKKAVRYLFAACIESRIQHVASYTAMPWRNLFWESHQLEVADYYPNEAAEFSELLLAEYSSGISPDILVCDLQRLLAKLGLPSDNKPNEPNKPKYKSNK